jgi:hypothetical protein
MIAAQLIRRQAALIDQFPGRRRQSVNEFGTEFDGDGARRSTHGNVLGGNAPADAVTSLYNGHVPAALGQDTASRQTRNTRTQYQNFVFDVVDSARSLEMARRSELFH